MTRSCNAARGFLTVASAAGILLCLLAPAQAEPPHGIKVHMHGAEGYAADGTLYTPTAAPPFAAIVLIPDERGMTARVNEAVSRFSERGFLVVALDLNRGLAPDAASHSEAEALHDLDATLSFVAAQSSVRPDAVGLMGWQSGGRYALRFAADPRVKAVAVIDALPPLSLKSDGMSRAPLLAAIAGRDARSSAQVVRSFQSQARQLGFPLIVKDYPKADADFDDPDSAHYQAAEARTLGKLQLSFFAEYLRH